MDIRKQKPQCITSDELLSEWKPSDGWHALGTQATGCISGNTINGYTVGRRKLVYDSHVPDEG